MRAVQEAELLHCDSCHLLWNVLGLWDLACDGRFSYYPQLGFYWRIIPCRPCLSLAFECSKLWATLLFPTHFSATRKKALTLYFYLLFCYSKKAQNCSTLFLNWFLSFSTTCMAGYSEDLSIGFAFHIFSLISPITWFSDTIFSRSCLIRDPIMRDILSQWILVLPKTSAVKNKLRWPSPPKWSHPKHCPVIQASNFQWALCPSHAREAISLLSLKVKYFFFFFWGAGAFFLRLIFSFIPFQFCPSILYPYG